MSAQPAPSLPSSPEAPRRRGKGKRKRARMAKAALTLVPPAAAPTSRIETLPQSASAPTLPEPAPPPAEPVATPAQERWLRNAETHVWRSLDYLRRLQALKPERDGDYLRAVESVALTVAALGFVASLGQFFG